MAHARAHGERFRELAVAGGNQKAERPSFADLKYWDARYNATAYEPFDWHLGWEQLKDVLSPFLGPETRILVLGCGTSSLSEEMYAAGFTHITNIDHCETLIDTMAAKHAEKTDMEYETVDGHDFPPEFMGKFDVVIDKAMLDCVACAADKWQAVSAVLRQASGALSASGVYVSVSHAAPVSRLSLLLGGPKASGDRSAEYSWQVACQTVPKPLGGTSAPAGTKDAKAVELIKSPAFDEKEFVYFVYTCKKC